MLLYSADRVVQLSGHSNNAGTFMFDAQRSWEAGQLWILLLLALKRPLMEMTALLQLDINILNTNALLFTAATHQL
jgi:hypothetical protein